MGQAQTAPARGVGAWLGRALRLGRGRLVLLAIFLALVPVSNPRIYAVDEVGYFVYLRSLRFDGDLNFENEYRELDARNPRAGIAAALLKEGPIKDGGRRSYGASLIQPDGSKQELTMDQFSIESTGTWKSPHTGATYPSGWTMRIDPGDGKSFTITLTPLVKDQELPASITSYWEGAVRIGGDVTGYGYAELTGYVQPMGERF